MADEKLDREYRQVMATTLASFLHQWGGEQYQVEDVVRPEPTFGLGNQAWENGTPHLASFISFLLFWALDQQPDDLEWLELPVDQWETSPNYLDFADYVKNKPVINDATERLVLAYQKNIYFFLASDLSATERSW